MVNLTSLLTEIEYFAKNANGYNPDYGSKYFVEELMSEMTKMLYKYSESNPISESGESESSLSSSTINNQSFVSSINHANIQPQVRFNNIQQSQLNFGSQYEASMNLDNISQQAPVNNFQQQAQTLIRDKEAVAFNTRSHAPNAPERKYYNGM